MAVHDEHVFPGFLTPVLTQLSFQSHQLLFSHASCRGMRQKYTGKKVYLNQVSNSQSQGHESDTLTIEPPRWGQNQSYCSLNKRIRFSAVTHNDGCFSFLQWKTMSQQFLMTRMSNEILLQPDGHSKILSSTTTWNKYMCLPIMKMP